MTSPRCLHAMCLYNGSVYAFTSHSNILTAERYSLTTETWTPIKDAPFATRTGTACENKIYMISISGKVLMVFDPAEETYQQNAMPALSANQKVFATHTSMFAIGSRELREISATGQTLAEIPGCDRFSNTGVAIELNGVVYYVNHSGAVMSFDYVNKTAPFLVANLANI